jgi:hypothetical protein
MGFDPADVDPIEGLAPLTTAQLAAFSPRPRTR